ncbi:MAG: stage II sporulation protein M [Gammaproteobacteria bacterium]|nr:stage II sporulation protein M [Gammaproteobacteria bacterium]MDE0444258.1 stage II sporulation protein M [Gammaproteobacteria bacterium]
MLATTLAKDNWVGSFLGAVFVLVVGLVAGIAIAEWINAMPAESTPPVVAHRSPGAEPASWELFAFILRRNMTVFLILLLGVLSAGLVTIVVLLGNGLAVGQLIGFARTSGMSHVDVAYLLLPHGVLELGALCVAGAVGLRGIGLAFGVSAVDRRAFESLRLGTVLVFGLVALATAAFVEAFVTVEIAESLSGRW